MSTDASLATLDVSEDAMWTAEMILVCALNVLHRSATSFPPIVLVDTRPSFVSAGAEAYVSVSDARIYLITSTPVFVRAKNALYKCGNVDAIRKIASLLVHEEWHVRHGDDEAGAYVAQLSTLVALDAGPGHSLYREVTTSMRHAIRRAR